MYRCLQCGNDECFNASQSTTQYLQEDVVLDAEGSVLDYGDSEVCGSETTDGPDNISCAECYSDDVFWYDSESEWIDRKKEYDEENKEPEIETWKHKILGDTWKDKIEEK